MVANFGPLGHQWTVVMTTEIKKYSLHFYEFSCIGHENLKLNGNFNTIKSVTSWMLHLKPIFYLQKLDFSISSHCLKNQSSPNCNMRIILEKERFSNDRIYRGIWKIGSYWRSTSWDAGRRKRKVQEAKFGFKIHKLFYANFFHVFESFERLLDDFGRNFHGYIRYVSITILEVRT